jgi:hypothetical protein
MAWAEFAAIFARTQPAYLGAEQIFRYAPLLRQALKSGAIPFHLLGPEGGHAAVK